MNKMRCQYGLNDNIWYDLVYYMNVKFNILFVLVIDVWYSVAVIVSI